VASVEEASRVRRRSVSVVQDAVNRKLPDGMMTVEGEAEVGDFVAYALYMPSGCVSERQGSSRR